MDHLPDVPRLLSRAGIPVRLKKCFFFADPIDYLSHLKMPGRLLISTKATDSIHKLQHPIDMTELESPLGLCNVFRRIVPNFARIAALLNCS